MDLFLQFLGNTGFGLADWRNLVMIVVGACFVYLAIAKKYEPLLLLPIGFGIILGNIPFFKGFGIGIYEANSVLHYLYFGVTSGLYPSIIFLGLGAMTDFSFLLANPKLMLLGAAAQMGIFFTYLSALALGFTPHEASSIGIIGGADGPTSIFLTAKLAPHLIGPVAIAAYSYMALVPIIQPPIMRALTTAAERSIRMVQLRPVSKRERIMFPLMVFVVCALLIPDATPLVGALTFGNLLSESGVVERLAGAARNELINIVTMLLGLSVGSKLAAEKFLTPETLGILLLGLVAFAIGTAGGVLLAKGMNRISRDPINPLIGAAGVSAVPMAARVVNKVGQESDPTNLLLMHAMGPNVAGVLGSAVAAGILLALVR